MEEDARRLLTDFYVETRSKSGLSQDSVSITARAMEALIRLAEASARVRLSEEATIEDAERAIRLTKNWRHRLMGENYDETTLQSGVKTTKRSKAQEILRFIIEESSTTQQPVPLAKVLNYCEEKGFSTNDVEDLIERMERDGKLWQPSTHGNYMPC